MYDEFRCVAPTGSELAAVRLDFRSANRRVRDQICAAPTVVVLLFRSRIALTSRRTMAIIVRPVDALVGRRYVLT